MLSERLEYGLFVPEPDFSHLSDLHQLGDQGIYAAAEGWPGWWGLEGPEYLGWLGEQPERDHLILMGGNTYRLMSGFGATSEASESDERSDEDASLAELTNAPKVVFSSTLQEPLSWPNTRLVSGDAVEGVGELSGTAPARCARSAASPCPGPSSKRVW